MSAHMALVVDSGDSRVTMPTVAEAIHAVAGEFGLSVPELIGERRDRRVTRPRQVAYWLARNAGAWSSVRIGVACGNRDHTTVLYGILETEKRRRADADFRARTDALMRRLLNPGQEELAV